MVSTICSTDGCNNEYQLRPTDQQEFFCGPCVIKKGRGAYSYDAVTACIYHAHMTHAAPVNHKSAGPTCSAVKNLGTMPERLDVASFVYARTNVMREVTDACIYFMQSDDLKAAWAVEHPPPPSRDRSRIIASQQRAYNFSNSDLPPASSGTGPSERSALSYDYPSSTSQPASAQQPDYNSSPQYQQSPHSQRPAPGHLPNYLQPPPSQLSQPWNPYAQQYSQASSLPPAPNPAFYQSSSLALPLPYGSQQAPTSAPSQPLPPRPPQPHLTRPTQAQPSSNQSTHGRLYPPQLQAAAAPGGWLTPQQQADAQARNFRGDCPPQYGYPPRYPPS